MPRPVKRAFRELTERHSSRYEAPTSSFIRNEQGQDLIEYTILMAFVALASAALFLGAGRGVKGIWGAANTQLTVANTAAS